MTQGFAFVDPDQCIPACDDGAFPKFCSIAYGSAKPDCTKDLPTACQSVAPKAPSVGAAAGMGAGSTGPASTGGAATMGAGSTGPTASGMRKYLLKENTQNNWKD